MTEKLNHFPWGGEYLKISSSGWCWPGWPVYSQCVYLPAVSSQPWQTFRSQPGYTAVLRLVAPMARTSARLKHWSYFVSTLSSTLSGLFTLSSTFRNSVLHPFWQPCSSASKLRFTVCSSGCVQIDMKRPVLIKLKVVEHHATISIHHQLCLRCNWMPQGTHGGRPSRIPRAT